MRNFHLSCKFCTLNINFSEVAWPNVLNTFRRPVNKNSLTWWHVLKISLQDVLKMSWRQFCKTSWRRLEDVWPRRIYWSWSRRIKDVFWRRMSKANMFVLIITSWRRFENVLWRRRRKMSSSRWLLAGIAV